MDVTPIYKAEVDHKRSFWSLLSTAAHAVNVGPSHLYRSIFGEAKTWLPPYSKHSEFNIFCADPAMRRTRYLRDILVPPLLWRAPNPFKWFPKNFFVEEPTLIEWSDKNGIYDRYPDESWFFINGMATNQDIAEMNAVYLASLFSRPLSIIQNPTDSIAVDFLETILGKGWNLHKLIARFAQNAILSALQDESVRKVVVIGHSQGTIITSCLLQTLKAEFSECDFLSKLEIYSFANCATRMRYVTSGANTGDGPRPYMESFGNEFDIVARTGMLAVDKARHGIVIDGEFYVRANAHGHLLNEHYLPFLNEFISSKNKDKKSRLLSYLS